MCVALGGDGRPWKALEGAGRVKTVQCEMLEDVKQLTVCAELIGSALELF